MDKASEFLAAEAAVKKIAEEYGKLADWNYEGKTSRIFSAKAIARKYGLLESIYLRNCDPQEYFGVLQRLLGRAAVDNVSSY